MFVFFLINYHSFSQEILSYQPVEVQKALEYQLGWFILFLGENVTENMVVVKEGFGMA